MLRHLKSIKEKIERKVLGPAEFYRRRGAKIGLVPIFSNPILAEPHLCEIGDNVWITARVVLMNHDGGVAMLNRAGMTDAVNVVGKIVIKDNVFIGSGSIIMGGVTIGPNVIVASGSIVTNEVGSNLIVGGCPAKAICSIDEYLDKYSEDNTLWIESESFIKETVTDFFMKQGHSSKKALRLKKGKTRLLD